MAVDFPFVYLDQLLSQTWVRLSENLLNRSHRQELTSSLGYQVALEEIFGSANSDDRTRAKELYRLGMLVGPLINPRDSDTGRGGVPLGWLRVQSGLEVHTRLGYCAYAIGKCLSQNVERNAVFEGLSVIAAICLFQCGVELTGRKWVTFASIFRHICASFPNPQSIESVIWERWLAHGMVAMLNDDQRGPTLVDAVLGRTPVQKLLVPRKGMDPIELNHEQLLEFIETNGSFSGTTREKASLYWSGTPSGNRPRGIFSLSQIAAGDLVDAACSLEVSLLSSGKDSPLAELSQRDPTIPTPCVLSKLRMILVHDTNARVALERGMKKLSEGVTESLEFLLGKELPDQADSKVFYAHGTEGKVASGVDQDLLIAKDKCIAVPEVGDFVQIGPHLLKIETVTDEGIDWRIVIR